nr:unnamed protein product [Digitaria exilis]
MGPAGSRWCSHAECAAAGSSRSIPCGGRGGGRWPPSGRTRRLVSFRPSSTARAKASSMDGRRSGGGGGGGGAAGDSMQRRWGEWPGGRGIARESTRLSSLQQGEGGAVRLPAGHGDGLMVTLRLPEAARLRATALFVSLASLRFARKATLLDHRTVGKGGAHGPHDERGAYRAPTRVLPSAPGPRRQGSGDHEGQRAWRPLPVAVRGSVTASSSVDRAELPAEQRQGRRDLHGDEDKYHSVSFGLSVGGLS